MPLFGQFEYQKRPNYLVDNAAASNASGYGVEGNTTKQITYDKNLEKKNNVTQQTGNKGNNGGNGGGSSNNALNDRYAGYQDTLNDLYNKVMGYGSYTPGSYSAKYDTSEIEGRLGGWLNEIDNYEAFKYDLNADMLYKQAVDNALQQGQMAMQDTMAQAAALTGGYGNSYAAAVGNQAYQNYVTQVNNNIPAYQQMAMDVWQSGLDQLMNQYNAGTQQLNNLLALEAQNFAMWQANQAEQQYAWNANYNQLLDQYNLGVNHIGNLEAYQPVSSGSGSGSGSKSSSTATTLKPVEQKYYNDLVNAVLGTGTTGTASAAQQQQYTLDGLVYALNNGNTAANTGNTAASSTNTGTPYAGSQNAPKNTAEYLKWLKEQNAKK